jgi:hypothetical protein
MACRIKGSRTYTGSGNYDGTFPELDAGFFGNGATGCLYLFNKFETPYRIRNLRTDTGIKGTLGNARHYMPNTEMPLNKAKVDMHAYTIKDVPASAAFTLPPYSLSFIEVRFDH